jgi:hypothetical protein
LVAAILRPPDELHGKRSDPEIAEESVGTEEALTPNG